MTLIGAYFVLTISSIGECLETQPIRKRYFVHVMRLDQSDPVVHDTFFVVITHPMGPFAGFLLDVEEPVDAGRKQIIGIVRKVPDFEHVLIDVPLTNGFM